MLSGWHFLALELVALPKTIEVACSLGDSVLLSAFSVRCDRRILNWHLEGDSPSIETESDTLQFHS